MSTITLGIYYINIQSHSTILSVYYHSRSLLFIETYPHNNLAIAGSDKVEHPTNKFIRVFDEA